MLALEIRKVNATPIGHPFLSWQTFLALHGGRGPGRQLTRPYRKWTGGCMSAAGRQVSSSDRVSIHKGALHYDTILFGRFLQTESAFIRVLRTTILFYYTLTITYVCISTPLANYQSPFYRQYQCWCYASQPYSLNTTRFLSPIRSNHRFPVSCPVLRQNFGIWNTRIRNQGASYEHSFNSIMLGSTESFIYVSTRRNDTITVSCPGLIMLGFRQSHRSYRCSALPHSLESLNQGKWRSFCEMTWLWYISLFPTESSFI